MRPFFFVKEGKCWRGLFFRWCEMRCYEKVLDMHSVVFNSGAINISYNKPRLNRVGINFSTYNAPNDLVPQLTGMNAVTLLVKGSRARKVGLEKIRRSIRDRKDILEGTTTESSHTLPYQWEYPGLKLLEKPFGRVDVTVTIFQRSEGANLFSYDQLMTAITDVYQGRYKAFNDDARKNAVTSGHIPTELYYYYPEDESWFHAKDINDN